MGQPVHQANSIPFLERLGSGKPLLADGAMGTLLHANGLPIDACFERQNLTRPEVIVAAHRAYLDSGAEMIETNTFAANRFKLEDHGLEDRVADINRVGVTLARQAIDESGKEDIFVAGSIGPLGIGLQPYGRLKSEDARAVYAEQIGGLIAGGIDVFLFETFSDVAELKLAIETAQSLAFNLPIIAEMTFGPDDRTLLGFLPGRVAHELSSVGVDVIGVNCSGGPAQIARILDAMHTSVPNARTCVMPNAGFPKTFNGRTMYPATVEYFADYALTFKAQGANIIGGCCGTTPAHIAAMRAILDDAGRALPTVQFMETPEEIDDDAAEHPTELAHKLANGQFVISIEMNPPRSHNFDRLLASAQMLREAGADVLNIADSPTARMRVSPWAVCQMLQSRLGMETILHFPTRGRNLLRVQGDLLGAHALGLRNIFVCMGDPTRIGDYPDAMDNYDIVPSGLIRLTKQGMNGGVDQAGNSIGQPTAFTVGCALNMGAPDIDKEIDVLRKKIEAGADFALGQPIFEPEAVEIFLERYEALEGKPLALPVLMGVMPLYSLKHALYLHNEVPGFSIPTPILNRIEDAGEHASDEGVLIAQELLRDLRDKVQGAYIIPAFGRYELAAQVIDVVAV